MHYTLSHVSFGGLLALPLIVTGCREEAPNGAPLAVVSAFVGDGPTNADQPRALVAELSVAGEPDCGLHPEAEYGFFVDVDPDASPRTGALGPALDGLGVDLRISARCEDGELVSPAGEVSVVEVGGEEESWLITITTNEPGLPRTFEWIAYARVGGEVSRVPEAPEVGRKLEGVL